MHFIIENVRGEHLQHCHNLITVCRNDTAVGGILNTNTEEDFSHQICILSDNVMPAAEIAASTTMCFRVILRGISHVKYELQREGAGVGSLNNHTLCS